MEDGVKERGELKEELKNRKMKTKKRLITTIVRKGRMSRTVKSKKS